MLSKGFYLGSIVGSYILIFILTIFFGASVAITASTESLAVGGVSALFLILLIAVGIYVTVINCVLLYKAWYAIQDEHARTTPGKAVGFLFIPFFNIYWVFQAYWGFSKDYNFYAQRYQVNAPKLPENLFLCYCILTLANFLPIPGIASIIAIAVAVIFIIMVIKICDAINALYIAGEKMAMEAQQSAEVQDLSTE